MEIELREKGKWTILDVQGEFVREGAQGFKEACFNCFEENKTQLVANFKDISFIDSAGMGAVIHCFQKAKANGGELALLALSNEIYDLFEMTSVDKLFTIYDSESEIS